MKYFILVILLFSVSFLFIYGQGGAIMPLSNKSNWCENQKVGCTCNDNVDFWRAIIETDFVKYHPIKKIVIDTTLYQNISVDSIFKYLNGQYRLKVPFDSIIKYSDYSFRKDFFYKLLNYVKYDSIKIVELSTVKRNQIPFIPDYNNLFNTLIKLSKYIKNDTTLQFLKDVVFNSTNNYFVVNSALALIKYNENELAFNNLKKLWYEKNDNSYNYLCHEGFKALNNSNGVSFLKFVTQDTIVCLSLDACVKLIEIGYADYSKPIIEKHLYGKYSLISIYLLLKHYYTSETILMVTDLLNKSSDEQLKYCGNLLLKKFEFNIIDY